MRRPCNVVAVAALEDLQMKYAVICGVLAVLAGCAGQPGVVPLSVLETPGHLVAERRLPMDFAAIQQALFKHERSEEHTSELQSLMRISYAVFCLKKKIHNHITSMHQLYR